MDFVHVGEDSFVDEVGSDFARDFGGDSHRMKDFDDVVLWGVAIRNYRVADLCHDLAGEILNGSENGDKVGANEMVNVDDEHLEVVSKFEVVVALAAEVEN
jgi:hypothetical protein